MADPNVNTPAEIYKNIRNKALEEAAKICEEASAQLAAQEAEYHGYDKHHHGDVGQAYADAIRALKSKEEE